MQIGRLVFDDEKSVHIVTGDSYMDLPSIAGFAREDIEGLSPKEVYDRVIEGLEILERREREILISRIERMGQEDLDPNRIARNSIPQIRAWKNQVTTIQGASEKVDLYLLALNEALEIALEEERQREKWREWKERMSPIERHVYDMRHEMTKGYKKRFRRLAQRDGEFCQRCGARNELVIDHIKPLSKWGGNEDENLQLLCRYCNTSKGGRE